MRLFGFHLPSLPTFLRDFEPARLQAIKASAIVLLASLGVTLSADVDNKVTAVVAVLITVLTWYQAESTRARVYSPATAAELAAELPPEYELVDDAGDAMEAPGAFHAAKQDEHPDG